MSKLRVTHMCPVTPRRCGMYETTRELVFHERKLGVNAFVVDPRPDEHKLRQMIQKDREKRGVTKQCIHCHSDITFYPEFLPEQNPNTNPRVDDWTEDRGICVAPESMLAESDVIVSHSGIHDDILKKTTAPVIHVAHGRPRSSFLLEHTGESPVYSMYWNMARNSRFKAFVTLWPEYVPYWELVFPKDKLFGFQPFVDLDAWTPSLPKHNWGGKGGKINVVCADIWRKDRDPYHVINAFWHFAEKYPEAKLHMYACEKDMRGWSKLFDCLQTRNLMGETLPMIPMLRDIYRSADLVITPHRIAIRTVREAMACGAQVVGGYKNPHTMYSADPENLMEYADAMELAWEDWSKDREECRKRNRQAAERMFDPRKTAGQFVELFDRVREVA